MNSMSMMIDRNAFSDFHNTRNIYPYSKKLSTGSERKTEIHMRNQRNLAVWRAQFEYDPLRDAIDYFGGER